MKKPPQAHHYVPSSFRWIQWDKANKRLDLSGRFTAQDLRNLAKWIDHPTKSGVINFKLSPL